MSGGCDNDNRPWCYECHTWHRDGDHERLCDKCKRTHGALTSYCVDCSRVDGYTTHQCAETECPRRLRLRIDTSGITREP
jgi:hypothetical protein